MPHWIYIPITIGGAALLATIIYVLLQLVARLQEVRVGDTAFVVHGRPTDQESPLGKALRHVPEHISNVSRLLAGRYYRLVKRKGVPEHLLIEMEDSRYAAAIIDAAVTRGNGSNSVQKVLESEILSRNWERRDTDTYVRKSVIPRVLNAVRQIINDRYDSVVPIDGHTRHERVVSAVEWFDDLVSQECRDELAEVILPFFEFARDCLATGCTEG